MSDLFDLPLTTLDGQPTTLAVYRGQVLLIVNVASRCGFTPQYAGLQTLYQTYQERGFTVLGFPCNQFARQEPGDAAEIRRFCSTRYNVTFPIFEKLKVNGADTHPLYRLLKAAAPGTLGSTAIKWNFTKFLVDRNGQIVKRFGPLTSPAALGQAIERLLTP
ncbi:MAG: glutathione peroxidase [Bacteroidales bacterium]|nr:glutathione peroxidase [Bacteroidales bacterium]